MSNTTTAQPAIKQASNEQIALETNRLYHEYREAEAITDAEYRKMILGIRRDSSILKPKLDRMNELKSQFHTYLAEYMRRINA